MTSAAIILILISAGLHSGWNLISKSGKPSPVFFFIVTLSTISLLSPFLLMNLGGIKTIPLRFWFLLIATGFFQTLYYTGLALSLSYMLVIASMKFVSNVSYVAGFRQLSIPLGVILGVVVLKEKLYLPRALGCLIIAAGLVITAVF